MKQSLALIAMCFSLIYFPLTVVQGFLLYQHVHATDLMWFLFWLMIPMGVVTNLITGIAKNMND